MMDAEIFRGGTVLSIVYTSSARTPFSDGDLAMLLMNSRANNRRLGLTGMLLHRQGHFLQVLEGPENAVIDRFTVIAADRRHTDLRTLIEEPIVSRAFPDWTMGYHASVDTAAGDLPGYNDFFDASADRAALPVASGLARQVLESLRHDLLAPAHAG
jgi:hypothetical protein